MTFLSAETHLLLIGRLMRKIHEETIDHIHCYIIALVNLKDAIVAIPSNHLECGLCLFPRFPLNHEDGSF